jgi:hypothetical protein
MTFYDLLSLKTDVIVPPTVSNTQKKLRKNLFFVGILKATKEKSRIRIRNPVVRVGGSGSVPRHGSGTLVKAKKIFH